MEIHFKKVTSLLVSLAQIKGISVNTTSGNVWGRLAVPVLFWPYWFIKQKGGLSLVCRWGLGCAHEEKSKKGQPWGWWRLHYKLRKSISFEKPFQWGTFFFVLGHCNRTIVGPKGWHSVKLQKDSDHVMQTLTVNPGTWSTHRTETPPPLIKDPVSD